PTHYTYTYTHHTHTYIHTYIHTHTHTPHTHTHTPFPHTPPHPLTHTHTRTYPHTQATTCALILTSAPENRCTQYTQYTPEYPNICIHKPTHPYLNTLINHFQTYNPHLHPLRHL
ncbi:hypothetical protein B484DRAFT_355888, partial [Ochromonadaceae sp. CCMP2298]